MWDKFPELGTLLRPLLDDKLKPGVVVIAAIICVWSIYQNWTDSGDRFSWFSALPKVAGVALVAIVAYNAESFIKGAAGIP